MNWGFEGINACVDKRGGWRSGNNLGSLFDVLTWDERYMENLWQLEAEAYLTDDYDDEWRQHCEEKCHEQDCCPDGTRKARRAYAKAVKEMFEDKDKRREWADSRLDWDWLRETLKDWTDDPDGVWYFLKEHPVDSVQGKHSDASIIDLTDVVGFCHQCDEPLQEADLKPYDGDVTWAAHPYAPFDPCVCEDPWGLTCIFDSKGAVAKVATCPHCGQLEHPEYPGDKHTRPFFWPPGAPWPPRRTFAGTPDEVPPYEES